MRFLAKILLLLAVLASAPVTAQQFFVALTSGQQSTFATLKGAANAAVNNNAEFLPEYTPAPTITFTASPDAALSNVVGYTANPDKITLVGGAPVKSDGSIVDVNAWTVLGANASPQTGGLNGKGLGAGASTWYSWAQAGEFETDAATFEVRLYQQGGEGAGSTVPVRMIVSDLPSTTGQYLLKAGHSIFANNSYYHVAFGSSKFRKIRIETRHFFISVRTAPGATVRATAPGISGILDGDSYTEGQSIRYGGVVLPNGHFSYGAIEARQLGWMDYQIAGVGATGYLNTDAGLRRKQVDRVSDWSSRSPAFVQFMNGFNDDATVNTYNLALQAWRATRSALPNTLIIVLGVPPGANQAVRLTYEQNIQAAFNAWGDPFSFFVPVNQNVCALDTDNVHWSNAGHATCGSLIYSDVLAKLNALHGSWLLQRDLEPAANNNRPAFVSAAA